MSTLDKLYGYYKLSDGVVTDTRKNLKGKIFFALKGPRFNGNKFALQAISEGASYAVVDEEQNSVDHRIILVDNVLETLQNLANLHRKKLNTFIIGITGSNGKTTNKELLHSALSQKFICYATKGNLNNHIGVPLSLLDLTKQDEIAIIEMGASLPGDIKELCAIAEPDCGYITNIGLAHIEGLGSKSGIQKEKGELFNHVSRKGGQFYVNLNAQEVVELSNGYAGNVTVGEENSADYQFQCLSIVPNVVLGYENDVIPCQIYGHHNYENCKMAAAISLDQGVSLDQVKKGLSMYRSENNRSQLLEMDGLKVFLDAYNANPSSMKASIESFMSFDGERKVLILGDMLELGVEEQRLHTSLLNFIVEDCKVEDVVLVGQCFYALKNDYPQFNFFLSTSDANDYVSATVEEGGQILIKGSRGIALEKLSIIQQMK
ncbi:UDP-N-acetylmuramoyl-tripeptide--D-alanyl-D-alanine ligase [Portibacter marinus]|uniref:UDP-N-acetylmuramoyl-tripeptide--D-alanyl-D- alanine ligase n=1 Tax=Portibacter marinus TaxID=2898660 RepID=UPI001F44DFE5|nr:UDP-N-acetylmuramoyl-tripeptide--D-alanyl-D-alanine ligase [Portibacter marinus]